MPSLLITTSLFCVYNNIFLGVFTCIIFELLLIAINFHFCAIPLLAHSFANKYPNSAEIHLTTQSKVVDRPIVWGGVEVGASYFFNKNLSVFANYNFVNNDFDEDKLVNTGLTPRNRAKFGIDFIKDLGFSFGASMRYQDEYTANFQDAYRFKGIMPSYSIYDAYVNHAFKSGLRLSISGQNIFNAKYRAYPFTPKIGNMFLFKMTYMFN